MKQRAAAVRGPAAMILYFVLAALVVAGCSAPERQRWLEVFFDDPPRAQEAAEAIETGAAGAVGAPREAAAAVGAAHAPYEAGACEVCHDLGGSKSFPGGGGWPGRRPDATRAAGSRRPETLEAARLRLPEDRLCGGCHDDLDARKLAVTHRVVHAPVAMGECTFCHDPHSGANPHLLKTADSSILCIACHDEESAERRCSHTDVETRHCVDCHDPHASGRAALLLPEVAR